MSRQQRAVNHEAGVSFNVAGLCRIAVNPVAIEGERRLAKQHCAAETVEAPCLGFSIDNVPAPRRIIGLGIRKDDQKLPFTHALSLPHVKFGKPMLR